MPNASQSSVNNHPIKVMFAGLFSLILTMGIARFAYTPMLPVMLDQTYLDDSLGGWLATINYMGYMTGVLTAASISDLKLKDTLYRISLIIAVISTIGMGVIDNYILWSIMRFIAGFSTAGGLLIGSGLILNWMIRNGHKTELGLHFGGVGIGVAVTAIFAMYMSGDLTASEAFTWQQQWQVFAIIAALLAIPAWRWLPRPNTSNLTEAGEAMVDKPPRRHWMMILYASYFCAGVGFVISATFLVAIVEQQLEGKGSLVWLVAGLAAALTYLINIIGIIIPAFSQSLTGMLISGFFFGATFIGIVSLMLTMVGKFYPTKPAKPMGRLTLSYGVAQIIAPAICGIVAETTGSYTIPLIFAAICMGVGSIFLVVLQFKERY